MSKLSKTEKYTEIFEELRESCELLGDRATALESFENIEDALHENFIAAQRQILGKYLSSYDINENALSTEKKTIKKRSVAKNNT